MSVTRSVSKQEKEEKPASAMVHEPVLPLCNDAVQSLQHQAVPFEQGAYLSPGVPAPPATPTKQESAKPNLNPDMASDTSSVLSQQQGNSSSVLSLPSCEQSVHVRKSAPVMADGDGDEPAATEQLDEQHKKRTRRRRASNPVRPMPSPFAAPEVQSQAPPPEPVKAGQLRPNNPFLTTAPNTTTNPTTSNRYSRWSNTTAAPQDASAPNSTTTRAGPPNSAPHTPSRTSHHQGSPTHTWHSPFSTQAPQQTPHPIQGVAVVSMAKPPLAPRPQGTPQRTEGMSRRAANTHAIDCNKYAYPDHDARGSGTVPAEKTSRFNWLFCGLCMAR